MYSERNLFIPLYSPQTHTGMVGTREREAAVRGGRPTVWAMARYLSPEKTNFLSNAFHFFDSTFICFMAPNLRPLEFSGKSSTKIKMSMEPF